MVYKRLVESQERNKLREKNAWVATGDRTLLYHYHSYSLRQLVVSVSSLKMIVLGKFVSDVVAERSTLLKYAVASTAGQEMLPLWYGHQMTLHLTLCTTRLVNCSAQPMRTGQDSVCVCVGGGVITEASSLSAISNF